MTAAVVESRQYMGGSMLVATWMKGCMDMDEMIQVQRAP